MEYEELDEVKAIGETDMAILCLIGADEYWIPKSVIGEDSEVQGEGDTGILSVKEWFARKEL